MNVKLTIPNIIAAGVLLPGALPGNAFASEPPTATNSTNIPPGDGNLQMTPSHTADDNRVTGEIRDALRSDKDLSPDVNHLVNISTNGQAVILRGALASTDDIDRVETLAKDHAGARQVINELTVIDF